MLLAPLLLCSAVSDLVWVDVFGLSSQARLQSDQFGVLAYDL